MNWSLLSLLPQLRDWCDTLSHSSECLESPRRCWSTTYCRFQQAIVNRNETKKSRQASIVSNRPQSKLRDTIVERILLGEERRRLTVERIILDAIFIEPLRTDDDEPSAGGSIRRTDRARSILRRFIQSKIQGTRTRRRNKCIDHFESPIGAMLILQKQPIRRREIACLSTYSISLREWEEQERGVSDSTEEAVIRWSINQRKRCPLHCIRRLIHRSLIDIPSDVHQCCAVANAVRIERNLGGWIDILIFGTRRTHRRNHTTEFGWIETDNVWKAREELSYPTATIWGLVSSTRTRAKPVAWRDALPRLIISTTNW